MKVKFYWIIAVVIIAIVLIVIFYPRRCGWWNSWDSTAQSCKCIGIITNSPTVDAGYGTCYGICSSCRCHKYLNYSMEVPCPK